MSKVYWSWKNIRGSLRRIWQNITRGWNDSDCWALDKTFARFALPRLKKLKEISKGYPSSIQISEEENFEEGRKIWKEILDKMIFSFQCIVDDNEDIYKFMPDSKFITVKCKDNDLYELVHDFEDYKEQKEYDEKFKIFKNKMSEREAKIQEGLDLFSKHFQSLWD